MCLIFNIYIENSYIIYTGKKYEISINKQNTKTHLKIIKRDLNKKRFARKTTCRTVKPQNLRKNVLCHRQTKLTQFYNGNMYVGTCLTNCLTFFSCSKEQEV